MRFFVTTACGIFLFLFSGCGGPVWLLDPASAEKIAREKNKPVILYFKAWDSTQHRNFSLDVLNNPSVKPELRETVNVELEFAFFPEYRRRYGVQQPQVCVMCRPDGTRVYTPLYVNPVPSVDRFLDWLRKAKAEAMPAPSSPDQPK